MRKWNKKTKIAVFIIFLILAVLFAALCWKKRRGIYNTYMKLTGQEIPYSVQEKRRKKYGYYDQELNASMNLENPVYITENDGSANEIETDIPKETTRIASSYEIDQQLQAELENGYSWEEPMVIQNPYQVSPLTAVIIFDTKEECAVRFTVKGKTEAADISGEVESAASHRIPVIGLYPAMENTVVLELLDKSGKVTDSQEITITTDELPDKLDDAVKPVKTSGESAFELTMVYGQRTTFPFAYDCMGDIRWYMSGEFTSGIYMLSNSRMIVASNEAFMPSQAKPQTTNLYEMDYLGRAYTMYYVAGGNHHEVIEKEPDGNLLVLTSSLEGHIEDKIQEIDRQTGEVVNELIMEDIFSGKYEDRVDWTHLNTVSYQSETDTIVISPRNLESVVKLNWTTKEIQWILCDPRFWEGTEYEKYVLQPEGDFVYQFQQHTAYQMETDLDGDDQTIEVSMFDNHYVKVRKSDVLQYFDGEKESYLLVYAVNEAEKTVKQIKKIVEEVKEELRAQNIEFGEVAQGIMIETPAAVMISRELAKEVDFFSIGTNDLTQYTLAIDRQNPKLDDFYDAHHPAVLEMIRMVAQNAHAEGIWAGICGELGADLELTEQFLQMGIDELSVSPGRILPIRKIVRESECGCE